MKHYKLRYVMHGPSEETEGKYMAEVPALPGCRAWGDTPEDALDILQSVATAFVESHIDHGDELPPAVASAIISRSRATGSVRPPIICFSRYTDTGY